MRYGITPGAYWPLDYWPMGSTSLGTPQEVFAGNFAIPTSSAIVFSVTEAIPFEIADPVI